MAKTPPFAGLARDPGATLDVLALALAAEFRDVEAADAMRTLDILGAELSHAAEQTNGTPEAHALACGQIIGAAHGFVGDQEHYDDPGNSMLDLVLRQRRGLPILLSVVYVEVARRAGIQIAGVGLPGATSSSVTSAQIHQSYWIPSLAADDYTPTPRRSSSGPGTRMRSRCGCSTTS